MGKINNENSGIYGFVEYLKIYEIKILSQYIDEDVFNFELLTYFP